MAQLNIGQKKMTSINLKKLIQTLNPFCQQTLEAAANACLSATHYYVEVAHWLLQLLKEDQSDIALILDHYGINKQDFSIYLSQHLALLKKANSQSPALSPQLVELIKTTLLLSRLEFGTMTIRSGYLLYALLVESCLDYPKLAAIKPATLREQLITIVCDSAEEEIAKITVTAVNSVLAQYTINLTHLAAQGKIDPVLGRDAEIRQVIDILMRRRQNNPILIGEPGVGKTAIVEGLALRIASGDVPAPLQKAVLYNLDLALLQAGAGIKGEFESRLKSLIDEIKNAEQPIILFIDEAHTLIGAGAQPGQNDAANLLKPALARGELRTIAATTWSEYKKYFEQDGALSRRFQVVNVAEPDEQMAVNMLRGLVQHMEQHHGVRILNEALTAAVYLSKRYIAERQLPDKAISVLDTACARLALSDINHNPLREQYHAELQQINTEITLLTRESSEEARHRLRLQKLQQLRQQKQIALQQLELRWQRENKLVEEIRTIRASIEQIAHQQPKKTLAARQKKLQQLTIELATLQNDQPLLHECVDAQAIAAVVSAWTGIPLGRMLEDETKALLKLEERLQQHIKGQPQAMATIAQRIQTARAQLQNPEKPIAVFLLVGPSGVGKTQTALTLADILYGGIQNMTTINLSEFKEEHKVSALFGAPPGYVGYADGGVLTEAVRKRPYSLVLLDEIEKAHPGVQDIFYQLFDKGVLRDGQGRNVNFKNTLLLLTSNVGSEIITKLCCQGKTIPSLPTLIAALQPELSQYFKPAFLARVTLIPYLPLSEQLIAEIIVLQLQQLQQRLSQHYCASLKYSKAVITCIAAQCQAAQVGARTIEHVINANLLPTLSAYLLTHVTSRKFLKNVHIDVNSAGFVYAHS